MARTPKHAAQVSWNISTNEFRVAKRLDGNGDYVVYTKYGYNCYAMAMDMARDNGKNVTITREAAQKMNEHACNIDHEWTIID